MRKFKLLHDLKYHKEEPILAGSVLCKATEEQLEKFLEDGSKRTAILTLIKHYDLIVVQIREGVVRGIESKYLERVE